ncbi:hypothetical protein DUNSADRAFT_4849 [Dunaliella salina]|uniref:Encoded protein n=1 Tax=Dunaliella salina TaxID=3046 RepID=A0ABQ7FUM0_DUNSA|nr:hypothetical protein DUNSADRAFT_4849 [Dunaliella salina]|eukprot:KAF5826102.1 hypothetical protein DUNSADRAFT_4849 [Dunaliella salina]
MALAAFLRFGMPEVPLEKLDLSHISLVGVSAQCLLRQLNRLLPPAPPEPEHAEAAPRHPMSMLQKSAAAFASKITGQPKQAWPPEPIPGSSAGHAPARPQTAPRRKLTEQQRLEEELREEVERHSRPPTLTQAMLLGCRVELDGGTAPKARMKTTNFPPNLSHGSAASGQRAHGRIASKSGSAPLDTLARKRMSFGRSRDELPPLQYYRLDLGVERPDRTIVEMLVEQELDARHHRLMCWYDMVLDGRVIRKNGRDIVPFDVLYEGWRCEGSIPQSGLLELGVACLPEGASPWWLNQRLQFNAVHLLNKRVKVKEQG